MRRSDRSYVKLAEERIDLLYRFAREVFSEDPSLADRYVEIARRISMRCRVRIPRELKRYTCKGCGGLLVPGANCRVRIRPERGTAVVVTCLKCGRVKRYPVG
jgi:ribonuclease P protein subunit RPR2